jgi:hypothetical protein
MAKFTSFDAPIGTAGPINVRRATAEDFGGTAKGLQIAGKALATIASDLQAKEERADVTRVQTLQSQAMSDLTGIISGLELSADLGAPGHIDKVKDQIRQYYAEREDQATTAKGRLLLQKQQAAVLSHFTIQAIGFQSGSVAAKVKSDFKNGLNADKNTLLHTPDDATLALLTKNNLDKINDKDGAIYHGLDAKQRAEFSKETLESLNVSRVQGLIRQDPEQTLIDLEAGKFDDDLNNKDVNPLRREARQALEGLRAADAAEIKKRREAFDKAVLEEQNLLYNELQSGKDKDGNDVSLFALSQKVMNSQFLKPFGVGSKDSFIRNIKLRASGQVSADFDRAVEAQQNEYLTKIVTGKNLDGTKADLVALKADILEDKIIDAFAGPGSKNTLIKMIDDKLNGVDTPLSRQQQEIYRMVTTKTDADGQELTDEQVIQIINDDKLLKIEGTAGKKAFRAMVGDISKAQFAKTAGVTEDSVYKRLLLPVDDPKHLGPEAMLDPKMIAKVGGFQAAERLRQIALKVKDKTAARLEKTINEFANRFKGRITNSIIGRKLDSTGDDAYVAFKEEVRELAAQAIKDKKDPFALFNSGNKEYVGDVAAKYGKPLKESSVAARDRLKGIIIPYRRKGKAGAIDPTKKQPGETTVDFLERRNKGKKK